MISSQFHRWGGLAAVTGGALWALTPLREDVFGGGGVPEDAVFRPYHLVIVIITALLTAGLVALHARHGDTSRRSGTAGTFMILGGYALLFLGSLPAVVASGESLGDVVRIGQDLGFLGAVISAPGGIPLGVALRRTPATPRLGPLLLITSFPVGLLGVVVVSAIGLEDAAGLPLTALYGGAWIVLGHSLWSEARALAVS